MWICDDERTGQILKLIRLVTSRFVGGSGVELVEVRSAMLTLVTTDCSDGITRVHIRSSRRDHRAMTAE